MLDACWASSIRGESIQHYLVLLLFADELPDVLLLDFFSSSSSSSFFSTVLGGDSLRDLLLLGAVLTLLEPLLSDVPDLVLLRLVFACTGSDVAFFSRVVLLAGDFLSLCTRSLRVGELDGVLADGLPSSRLVFTPLRVSTRVCDPVELRVLSIELRVRTDGVVDVSALRLWEEVAVVTPERARAVAGDRRLRSARTVLIRVLDSRTSVGRVFADTTL